MTCRLVVPLICLALMGCAAAAKTSVTYVPSGPPEIQNEAFVPEPFDAVWDKLVAQLSKSYFVINNIEKESRLINLSFTTESPEDYIDCGRTIRTYKKGGDDLSYNYAVAEDSAYKYSKQLGPNSYANYDIVRTTELEGRMNVFVAPKDGGTTVSVNCRYAFTVNATGTYETIGGALEIVQDAGVVPAAHNSLSFNTGAPGTENWGTDPGTMKVTCATKGVLEAAVLDIVRQP